jgi:hypothetical protein
MKQLIYPILTLFLAINFVSCDKYETYADKKDKERSAINTFINKHGITVISESTFNAQGQTTDLSKNEFVLLDRTGVYMQIVRKGCGSKMEENKTITLLCRFMERDVMKDTMTFRNDQYTYMYDASINSYIDGSLYVDKISAERKGTTITASFVSGLMLRYHGAQVPSGWMVPLNYVNVGRPETVDDEISLVRLIVPHSQGTSDAQYDVTPYYYELSFEKE